jgi:hypothetical protein
MNKGYFPRLAVPGLLLVSLLAGGCGNNTTPETPETPVDTTKQEVVKPSEVQKYAQVPSPGEMFTFIKQLGNKGKDQVSKLNATENSKKYNDNKSKALNFGVYSADLLYCSTFGHGAEALKYFVNVKKLGDDIGISTAINEQTAKRIEANIGNPDSLGTISNDLYFTAFDHLESNERGNTLALVMAGGWVESLYMVTSMEPAFKKDNALITRVGEQKYTLENLIEFMKKYETDADVASIETQLNDLKAEFDKIEDSKGSAAITMKGNKKVLGGGSTKVGITADQYKAIVEKTATIRKSMTQN